jgi:hypothetical protein
MVNNSVLARYREVLFRPSPAGCQGKSGGGGILPKNKNIYNSYSYKVVPDDAGRSAPLAPNGNVITLSFDRA